ncbi:MAG TPA: sugar phosphate isomerase/epimerase [Bryobacteraceae bacterium]|nr:sugar phosphate isomerase/epimerase [Bryobacteraceae bacterium]
MTVTRRAFLAHSALASLWAAGQPRFRFGHHFYNWDQSFDLELKLRLTAETGWEGFEAKPEEFGVPAAELRKRATALKLSCAAVGGSLKPAIDYAHAAGAGIARVTVSKDECARWVDYAGERGVILVVHNHIGGIETREQLLRYLDERPGTYACPDTGHLALCGSDPVQTIRDLGSRCRYVHLKDIDPAKVGTKTGGGDCFWDLGTGAVDLEGVRDALLTVGYKGWVMVERDRRVPDYAASARNMRQVVRKLFERG